MGKLSEGDNRLQASGQFGDKTVQDAISWRLSPDAASHIRIDSGAMMGLQSSKGRFGSDAFFVGGEASGLIKPKGFSLTPADPKGPAKLLPGVEDPELLASFREGDFSYDIPVENGVYNVRLSFVAPAEDVVGARIFDVTANGAPTLTALDITAAAGGALKPLERQFSVTVSDGRLKLGFHPSAGKALVSAIEINR